MSQNTPSFFLKRFSGFLHFIFALIALTGVARGTNADPRAKSAQRSR